MNDMRCSNIDKIIEKLIKYLKHSRILKYLFQFPSIVKHLFFSPMTQQIKWNWKFSKYFWLHRTLLLRIKRTNAQGSKPRSSSQSFTFSFSPINLLLCIFIFMKWWRRGITHDLSGNGGNAISSRNYRKSELNWKPTNVQH